MEADFGFWQSDSKEAPSPGRDPPTSKTEISILRQNIDALARRCFGASSEKIDPGQKLFDFITEATGEDNTSHAPAAPGPLIAFPKKPKKKHKTRAPRIPDHLPVEREEIIPAQVQLNPEAFRRMGEEITEQIQYKRAEFFRKQIVRVKYAQISNPAAATPKPNWLFVGNGESGRKCAILYTIVENCRIQGIDVRDYLTDVITCLPGIKARDAASLTPANWKKARSAEAAAKIA